MRALGTLVDLVGLMRANAHESPRTCRAPGEVGGARREGDAEKPGFLEAQVSHPGFHVGTEWKMQGQLLGRPETRQVPM